MKTTLIIDGNWLLMGRAFVMDKCFLKDNTTEMKEEGEYRLTNLLASSVSVVLNRFKDTINNILLVSDGKSWRKKLEKPTCFQEDYKGNRDLEVEYDWDYIFGALDSLCDRFKKLDITTSHHADAEGDDLVYYWSRRLNREGINAMIWSSDNDLKQLIQVDNGCFTCWYNDRNGLFLHNDLKEKVVDDMDFFMQPMNTNPLLERIKMQAKDVHYINPDEIVMEKIVCGDSGDNIRSLVRVIKGGRKYGVGETDWKKIKDELNIEKLGDFYDKKEQVINKIANLKKFQGLVSKQDLEMMWDYNIKLVWLNENVIPEHIIQDMNKEEYKEFDVSEAYNNYKIFAPQEENNIEKLFEEVF